MEYLEHLKEYILTVHPVRRSSRDKAEFRRWAISQLKREGWKVREETYGRTNGSVNVVAGDPDRAQVVICARYDTASRMFFPNFVSPTNGLLHVCYHAGVAVLAAGAALAAAFAVSFPLGQPGLMLPLTVVLLLAFLALSAFGPTNRENANGNSSGVTAVLSLARALAGEKRVCLVLLDNSDKNYLGAKAFARRHADAAARALFINLDCVGDGEHMLFMPSKRSRWDAALIQEMEKTAVDAEGVKGKIVTAGFVYYPSDHRAFRFHVAVCACRKRPVVGYYIPHLRTGKDRTLELRNIRYLTNVLGEFSRSYLDRDREEKV